MSQSREIIVAGFTGGDIGGNGRYVQRGTGNAGNNGNKKVAYFVQPGGAYHCLGAGTPGSVVFYIYPKNTISAGQLAYSTTASDDSDPASATWPGGVTVTSALVTDPLPKYSWVNKGVYASASGVHDVYVAGSGAFELLLLGWTTWGGNSGDLQPIIKSTDKGGNWAAAGNYANTVTEVSLGDSKLCKLIAISASGTKALSNGFFHDMQSSTISGTTWLPAGSGAGLNAGYGVDTNSTATVSISYKYGGAYKSTDLLTWTQMHGDNCYNGSIDNTGNKIAGQRNGTPSGFEYSLNGGSSFTQLLTYGGDSVAFLRVLKDGTFLMIAGGVVYHSVNDCSTWTPFSTLTSWFDNWGFFWDTSSTMVSVDHINRGSGGGGTNKVYVSLDESLTFSEEYTFSSPTIIGDSYIITADQTQIIIPYRNSSGVGVLLGTKIPSVSAGILIRSAYGGGFQ